jgi:glycosyltransferase involved in cell wall biosynthesis
MVKKLTSLSIFMPAYNEEGNIATTILDADKAAKKFAERYEIIVVNDGSVDQTATIVSELAKLNPHLKLVNHQQNRGYGAAVKTGLAHCRYDWIFFTDSDGQFHYDELGKFVEATKSADLVMGFRKKRMDPFHRVFVAQVLLKIWNFVLFGLTVRDVDCAYKLFSKKVRDQIKLKTESAITVSEFIIKAKAANFRIKQLPVHHYPRRFGEQTGGNWRVIVRAARESFVLYQEIKRRP